MGYCHFNSLKLEILIAVQISLRGQNIFLFQLTIFLLVNDQDVFFFINEVYISIKISYYWIFEDFTKLGYKEVKEKTSFVYY